MDYREARKTLAIKRHELATRLAKIKLDLEHHHEPVDPDFAEQAVQRENDEVLEALAKEASVELAQIQQAFERIDNYEYEICSECGEDIGTERLSAIPYATRCICCEKKLSH